MTSWTKFEREGVPDPDVLPQQRRRDAADALLVAVGDHDHSLVVDALLDGDDLADPFVAVDGHDVEGLVEHDLTAQTEVLLVDGRADRDTHLAAAGDDVDRAVVGRVDDEAVGARRLRETVDLLLQGDDLLARVPQRAHQALVLGRQRRQARLDVGQPCLELTRALRRVSRHLTQRLDRGAQGCELAVSGSGDSCAVGTLGVWVADAIRHVGLLDPSLAHSDDSTLTPGQPMSSDVSASDRRTRRIVLSLLTRSPSASGVQASAGMSVDAVAPGTPADSPPASAEAPTPGSPVTPASVASP